MRHVFPSCQAMNIEKNTLAPVNTLSPHHIHTHMDFSLNLLIEKGILPAGHFSHVG